MYFAAAAPHFTDGPLPSFLLMPLLVRLSNTPPHQQTSKHPNQTEQSSQAVKR